MMRRFRVPAAALCVCLGIAADSRGQGTAFELQPNLGWLNTDRPLRFSDELKGHVVLLDFWTYCCINCHNIIADLEYLERKHADQPVVIIGVHSAKFAQESVRANIRNAMFRYGLEHAVVVDDQQAIWKRYGIQSWPSLLLIGSDGRIIGVTAGEGNRAVLDREIEKALAKGREDGTLAQKRFEVRLDAAVPSATGLAFPGKIHGADGRLFIADSTNDRVIMTTWPDEQGRCQLVQVFGGERGYADGPAASAMFDDPQGMVLDPDANILYIADTRNHSIRAIDLATNTVSTLVGTGEQGRDRNGGGFGTAQAINAPWALALSTDRRALYVAMAGPHQLWIVDLESRKAEAIAGGRGENIVDGRAERALLAQPSGLALASDGSRLYFADSEVSAVRFLNLKALTVGTLIGTGLFDFGDVDGAYPRARLQHPLGVTVLPGDRGDRVLVADTYNSKIKIVNPRTRGVQHWLGRARGSAGNDSLVLNEPGGLHLATSPDGQLVLFIADTNNHRVVMVDPGDKSWKELMIAGLEPSRSPRVDSAAIDADAALSIKGPARLRLDPTLPVGAKLNREAPVFIAVSDADTGEPILQSTLDADAVPVIVELNPDQLAGREALRVELSFGYCFQDESVCLPAELAWRLRLSPEGADEVTLKADVR